MKQFPAFKSLALSVAIHAALVLLFLTRPLYLKPNFSAHLGKTPPLILEEDEMVQKSIALEEAFHNFIITSEKENHPSSTPEVKALEQKCMGLKKVSLLLPKELETDVPSKLTNAFIEVTETKLPLNVKSSLPVTLSQPSIQTSPVEMVYQLPESSSFTYNSLDFEVFPAKEKTQMAQNPFFFNSADSSSELLTKTDVSLNPEDPISFQKPFDSSFSMDHPLAIKPEFIASLTAYGIPEVDILNWNEIFDVDVKTFAEEEGGYLFSVSLVPKVNLSQFRIKQNFYFLIDRSNSIEKHRYQTFKRAVSRAISALHEEDRFNIIVFDSKISQLSSTLLPCTKKNQKIAEEFLENQPHGHFKSTVDIYTALNTIKASEVDSSEVQTAILISDGVSTLKYDQQRKLMNNWISTNLGKVTLCTAAVGSENNLTNLDLLSSATQGQLVYSDTHTGFPRKLSRLLLTVRNPIAKQMVVSVVPSDSASKIQLYPSSTRLPVLMGDRPYTFYGKAEKLIDFTLTLEGRNQGNILTIKKKITFSKAKPGNRTLTKEWAIQDAYACYEKYLKDGKISLLEKAKKILVNESPYSQR